MRLLMPLLDLFFPRRCVLCGEKSGLAEEDTGACASCLQRIQRPDVCCPSCAHPVTDEMQLCPICRNQSFSFSAVCAVTLYRGTVKKTIHQYKYRGCKDLAQPLGKLMAMQIVRCRWPVFHAVVPVPLHREKLLLRGYDQALLLAQVVASELELPVEQLLLRERPTFTQTKLDANGRWTNVAGAFKVVINEEVPQRVLLIDDLLTTGATAHFAGEALLHAGVSQVFVAVVGR